MAKRLILQIIAAFSLLAAFMVVLLYSGVGVTYAATTEYSNVLVDLQKDPEFKETDYAADNSDYSLKVIQIAESAKGELFLYVYQPAANMRQMTATYINMALTEKLSNEDTSYTPTGNEFGEFAGGGHGGGGSSGRSVAETAAATDDKASSTQLYSLKLLNRNGVFAKYVVIGFKVKSDTTRYYNITSIYRAWDSVYDDEADFDNSVEAVAVKVGQLWTATDLGDSVTYAAKDIEVIALPSQTIGMHRYADGVQFDGTKACDSHYIAFTTDKPMDKLLSADVEFYTRSYKALKGSETTYGDPMWHRVTLYDYQVASNDGGGWFGKKADWHRISSVSNFVKEVELTDEEKDKLSSFKWILNFYESEFTHEIGTKDFLISGLLPFGFIWTTINGLTTTGELVFAVSVLRMEYKHGGQIYNVGVVSDMQTGSNEPQEGIGFWEWLGKQFKNAPYWVWIIVGVVALSIVLTILSIIFPPVRKGLIYAFKGFCYVLYFLALGFWYVVASPGYLIAFIVRNVSERKAAAPTKTGTRKGGKELTSKPRSSRSKAKPKAKTSHKK